MCCKEIGEFAFNHMGKSPYILQTHGTDVMTSGRGEIVIGT